MHLMGSSLSRRARSCLLCFNRETQHSTRDVWALLSSNSVIRGKGLSDCSELRLDSSDGAASRCRKCGCT